LPEVGGERRTQKRRNQPRGPREAVVGGAFKEKEKKRFRLEKKGGKRTTEAGKNEELRKTGKKKKNGGSCHWIGLGDHPLKTSGRW